MYRTAGELKKALEQIPDDTPLVRTVFKLKVAPAHVSGNGWFIGFHHDSGECRGCKFPNTKIEQMLTID